MSRGVVKLIKKDLEKMDKISNLEPITLLNIELNILAKVLTKRLACVMGEWLVREAG